MPRASVIRVPRQKPRELNQGGTSTSEVVFTSDGTIPVVLDLPSAGELASAAGTPGVKFKVRAGGRVTGGTTTNYTPQLQFGTSATPGSNTDLESGGAVAVNSVSGFWFIEADLFWDTTSNQLDGYARHMVSGSTRTYTAAAACDNRISSADPDANGTQGFVVTGTFSSGNASNAAYLDFFELEY